MDVLVALALLLEQAKSSLYIVTFLYFITLYVGASIEGK
jgi:hypothetical protein